MDELENKIEEAAQKMFTKRLGLNKFDIADSFIEGAKSPEAKAYWQEGMYTESEVRNIFIEYMWHWGQADSDEDVDKILDAWKKQHKKK